jgi:hypothetical protein
MHKYEPVKQQIAGKQPERTKRYASLRLAGFEHFGQFAAEAFDPAEIARPFA